MNRSTFNQYLSFAQFTELFNELGWDRAGNHLDTSITIDDVEFDFKAVSQKRGFIIYVAVVDVIPQNALCRKIDIRLRRYSNDYILIFTRPGSEHQLWITPVKTVEKRDLVTIEYQNPSQAEFLFNKLSDISFEIDEDVTIVDVTTRIHKAFEVNATKITKDFYSGFKQQHKSFANFIQGIDVEGDKQWYASVMLNRLMFCYFIQKKGFLNFDEHYLRNKLIWSQEQRGKNQFFSSFYKGFLLMLFRGGLNTPTHNNDFEKVYGRIPYLNGGMFDEHQLEKQYENIDINDQAFETLFDFFDKWRWHLDTRITATGRDINPDVLGYIFEQYINDRAKMGAYYTKEDITEYIGKNCIIPFLMDEVAKTSSGKHFTANGYVWQTLKSSGDKYIYNAVKKGIKETLPDYIEIGIDTTQPNLLERRARWNEQAFESHALPTEIWRETVERRRRCNDLIHKISNGEITHINDFITYNLDIRSFVQDLLDKTSDHLFILYFYHALQRITILDPTCGSGAFLFAALNILEPLYEICIARMEEFNSQNQNLFKDELAEITNKYRSNIQHFIYKSIILRNLYGVDIMVEATEIAKLRLFLKMVAVVDVNRRADNLGLDPLPDIDFNIRCGNTLVGYATENELNKDLSHAKDIYEQLANIELKDEIEENMEKVAMAYEVFKKIQLEQHIDMDEFKKAKSVLNLKLKELNNTLNKRLHTATTTLPYDKWLASHQPFHWLAEFYQIIKGNGGFDVIIGNPPYVGYTRKNKQSKKAVCEIYKIDNYITLPTSNLYPFTIERSYSLMSSKSKIGMIIPISAFANESMKELQILFKEKFSRLYVSTFHQRPAQLFEGVLQRLSIFIASKSNLAEPIFTTGIYRWKAETRNVLFSNIFYTSINQSDQNHLLKIGSNIEKNIYDKYRSNNKISKFIHPNNSNNIYYRTAGGGYWVTFLNDDFESESVSNKSTSIISDYDAKVLTAALNSNLFWWYYSINFDLFNFKDYMIFGFQLKYPEIHLIKKLTLLSEKMENALRKNAVFSLVSPNKS